MEHYNAYTIDELARVVLPHELRCELGLNTGSQVSLKPVSTLVILQLMEDTPEPDSFVCPVDDLGRIELPCEVCQQLGWHEKDKLDMYNIDNLIILKKIVI